MASGAWELAQYCEAGSWPAQLFNRDDAYPAESSYDFAWITSLIADDGAAVDLNLSAPVSMAMHPDPELKQRGMHGTKPSNNRRRLGVERKM